MFRVALISSIFALFACAGAIWSAYEAHLTRVEGRELGSKALDVQLAAFRADERPYITVAFDGMKDERIFSGPPGENKFIGVHALPHIKLTAAGRTPSTSIGLQAECFAFPSYHDFLLNGRRKYKIAREEKMRKELSGFPLGMLFPNNSREANCSDFIPHLKNLDGARPNFIFWHGLVTYRDAYNTEDSTPFCFQINNDPQTKFMESCAVGSSAGGKDPD